jgi:hypothetical protein
VVFTQLLRIVYDRVIALYKLVLAAFVYPNSIFAAVASGAPKNNNFSSPAKIIGAQQLILHMKYSKFQ